MSFMSRGSAGTGVNLASGTSSGIAELGPAALDPEIPGAVKRFCVGL